MVLLLALTIAAALPPGHPAIDAGAGSTVPSVNELIAKLDSVDGLKDRDKPFEVAVSMGQLYAAHGRYAEAVELFKQAEAKSLPLQKWFAAAKTKAGTGAWPEGPSIGCAVKEGATQEGLWALAKAKKVPAEAASCAKAALQGLAHAQVLLSQAQFLKGDAVGALATLVRGLALFESNPDARYGRAALLLDQKGNDVAALKVAKADLDWFLSAHGSSTKAPQARQFLARVEAALAAGGVSKVSASVSPAQAQGPAPLAQATIDAFARTERTQEMQAGWAKTLDAAEGHLAKGQFQSALDSYKQVMPYQPDNPRVQAGMAWSLVGLGKPMADRVWSVASSQPAAIEALGDKLKALGDAKGARAVWTKLRDTVPGYGPKLEEKLK